MNHLQHAYPLSPSSSGEDLLLQARRLARACTSLHGLHALRDAAFFPSATPLPHDARLVLGSCWPPCRQQLIWQERKRAWKRSALRAAFARTAPNARKTAMLLCVLQYRLSSSADNIVRPGTATSAERGRSAQRCPCEERMTQPLRFLEPVLTQQVDLVPDEATDLVANRPKLHDDMVQQRSQQRQQRI